MSFLLRESVERMRSPLLRGIETIVPKRTHLVLGVFYHRSETGLEILAEVRKGAAPEVEYLKLPGGHAEKWDKTRKRTLLREFFEECGQELDPDQLMPLTRTKNRRGRDGIIIADAFAMEMPDKPNFTPSDGEDIAGYEWVSAEEFKRRAQKDTYKNAIDGWLEEIQQMRANK